MRLDAADRADVLAGIRDEGSLCTWTKWVQVPVDPDNLWMGYTNTPSDTPVWCMFVDPGTAQAFIKQYSMGTEVNFRSRYGILGWHGIDLDPGEVCTLSGVELVAKNVAIAKPADIPIFFVVEFEG